MTSLAGKTGFVAMAVAVVLMGADSHAKPQSKSPAETAAKLAGGWRLNTELTPISAKSGRGQPSFAVARAVQRGGRGGGSAGSGGDSRSEASAPLTAEEAAAQAALSVLHQVPTEMTIEATSSTITFRDPRGEWRYTIDGKNTPMDVPGGLLHSKSRWDRGTLRQEFSSGQRRLVKIWIVNASDRLVLTERFESFTLKSESKAVFDRQ